MRALLLGWLLMLAACEGKIAAGEQGTAGGNGGGAGSTGGGAGGGTPGTNLDVYTRLKVTCGGCHVLTERPYFASLAAFETSIAYDVRWVVPGNPAASAILDLLQGKRVLVMPPLPQENFGVLSTKGQTQITIPELEDWIRNLPPRTSTVPLDVPVLRRKSSEMVIRTLFDQLGLVETDFYDGSWNPKASDSYAVRSPDAMPYADPFDQGGTLFMAMGGPFRLEGKLRNDAPSQGFVQALTHVSQAWCRTAFNKASNPAVFTQASLSDKSTTAGGPGKIRANIQDLYLRMLGAEASPAEVDDLYTSVFLKYESKGTLVAWTAVCASLVRDPLWMLY